MTTANQTFSLTTRPKLRMVTLFFLYFAQGLPEGLLYVAVPAWLAANGASASDIGSYIAIILLPWSFKLINGLLMDRWQFPAMGKRRPWILAAQLLMVLVLCALAASSPAPADLSLLAAAGFLINLAAAFQDVAIDGMAIDIVPAPERGKANGVMWGGKTLGIASSTLVCGMLLQQLGFQASVLAVAVAVGAILLLPLWLIERPGEKRLPWSRGTAAPTLLPQNNALQIIKNLVQAMLRPQNLWFAGGVLIAFSAYGLKTAYVPVLAIQQLGMTQDSFAKLAAAADLAGGLFGIILSGWIADRIGHARALMLALAALASLHLAMAAAATLWAEPWLFPAYFTLHALLFVMLSVAVYASAMDRCRPAIGATQFSAFMALLNLGTSAGAQTLGLLPGGASVFTAAGLLALAGLGLFARATQRDAALDQRVE